MAIATKKICSRGHVFQKSKDFPTCPVCWPGRYKSEGKTSKTISTGVVHDVPKDMEEALTSDAQILSKWNGLTPIQRNEWICWTTIVKKPETRAEHIERMMIELQEGKRQPCCWPGCPHRRPKAKKWFK